MESVTTQCLTSQAQLFFLFNEVFDWVQVTLVSADAELNEGGGVQRRAKKPLTPPWQPQAEAEQMGHRIATGQDLLLWQPCQLASAFQLEL